MTMLVTEDPVNDDEPRRIVMHVNFADRERLTFVLNNVENIFDYYHEKGNEVAIRVVCHGPGLHLLRTDTSPVKERLVLMAGSQDELGFYACTNTVNRMARAEGRRPKIMDLATMVPSGLVELIELDRAGWTYIKP